MNILTTISYPRANVNSIRILLMFFTHYNNNALYIRDVH